MRISDWSSDVCSSDLPHPRLTQRRKEEEPPQNGVRPELAGGPLFPSSDRRSVLRQAQRERIRAEVFFAPSRLCMRQKKAGRSILHPAFRSIRQAKRLISDRKSTRLNSSH